MSQNDSIIGRISHKLSSIFHRQTKEVPESPPMRHTVNILDQAEPEKFVRVIAPTKQQEKRLAGVLRLYTELHKQQVKQADLDAVPIMVKLYPNSNNTTTLDESVKPIPRWKNEPKSSRYSFQDYNHQFSVFQGKLKRHKTNINTQSISQQTDRDQSLLALTSNQFAPISRSLLSPQNELNVYNNQVSQQSQSEDQELGNPLLDSVDQQNSKSTPINKHNITIQPVKTQRDNENEIVQPQQPQQHIQQPIQQHIQQHIQPPTPPQTNNNSRIQSPVQQKHTLVQNSPQLEPQQHQPQEEDNKSKQPEQQFTHQEQQIPQIIPQIQIQPSSIPAVTLTQSQQIDTSQFQQQVAPMVEVAQPVVNPFLQKQNVSQLQMPWMQTAPTTNNQLFPNYNATMLPQEQYQLQTNQLGGGSFSAHNPYQSYPQQFPQIQEQQYQQTQVQQYQPQQYPFQDTNNLFNQQQNYGSSNNSIFQEQPQQQYQEPKQATQVFPWSQPQQIQTSNPFQQQQQNLFQSSGQDLFSQPTTTSGNLFTGQATSLFNAPPAPTDQVKRYMKKIAPSQSNRLN